MSTADGLHDSNPEPHVKSASHPIEADGVGDMTLAGNLTLSQQYRRRLRIDPGGSARDVNLPAEASSNGLSFILLNTADAGENLVVKDDGGTTIVTISQNEKAEVVCDGTTWYHMGIETIALS